MRNDPKYGFRTVYTPKETLGIEFGDETLPLGFSLQLRKLTRKMNPGGMGDAAIISSVEIIDEARGIDREGEIAMNQPLTYGKFTIYQTGFNKLSSGENVSIFKVTYDPGRFLKYLGCVMVCLGIALRYLTNSPFYKSWRQRLFPSAAKAMPVILLVFLGVSPAFAGNTQGVNFDWGPWRRLPVQADKRQKPLDTLAREDMLTMTGRETFADPDTGQPLDATAWYLDLLFDWQGWDQAPPHPPADSDTPLQYFRSHQPDKWDRAPLLYIDAKELRKALGLSGNQAHISPFELSSAKITDPQTSQAAPFLEWVERLARANKKDASNLEKKAVELAAHWEEYVADRTGQRLEILPLKDNPHKQWGTLAMLVLGEFDDQTDPQGLLRKAKADFLKARAAYRTSDAQAFREASAEFLAAVKDLGPALGPYPSAEKIDLEVAYNGWAPFRLAWILSSIALGCAVSSKLAKSKPMHVLAWLIFLAGFLAMIAGFAMRSAIADRAPSRQCMNRYLAWRWVLRSWA